MKLNLPALKDLDHGILSRKHIYKNFNDKFCQSSEVFVMNHSVLHIGLLFSHWVIIFSRSKHGQNEILWSSFAFLWRLVYWTSELIKRLLAGIEFGDIKRAAIVSFSSDCNKENIQERPSVPNIDKSQGVKVQNYRWENICNTWNSLVISQRSFKVLYILQLKFCIC